MSIRCLPALLLVACAGSAPSTLERGTMTRPPPAQHRPGVGAPVLGQPSAHGAAQRSPHKRVLPASTVPGIWAGDRSTQAPSPVLLGIRLPVPEETLERIPVQHCLSWVQRGLQSVPEYAKKLEGASEERRRCVANRLFAECLLTLVTQGEQAKSAGAKLHEEGFKALGRMNELAHRRQDRACRGVELHPDEHHAWIQASLATVKGMEGQ